MRLSLIVGTKDLFGRELRMTQMNFVDGIAASAVMMMGEGAGRRGRWQISENTGVEFCDEINRSEVQIPLEEDLYYSVLDIAQAVLITFLYCTSVETRSSARLFSSSRALNCLRFECHTESPPLVQREKAHSANRDRVRYDAHLEQRDP